MNPTQLIARKRDGGELTPAEITWIIDGYVAGQIPEYQMAAMLLAIYVRGLTNEETAALTESMLKSGVSLEWPDASSPRLDKHSTGGIGDKVSLPLAPLLACCDVYVPMLSGRGLGPTGGTLDKLESIAGFRTNLSLSEIQRTTAAVGCVITGTTPELVPADRQLYALRDVTATVPSVPLITASIMSKKLAEGLSALVLDVKYGSGAFMKSVEIARELATGMVSVGQKMGVATTALLTDMNQPLGRMAGNAVEVEESLEILRGRGPSDLRELVIALGAEVLVSSNKEPTPETARVRLVNELDSGRALERFEKMVSAQGGHLNIPRPISLAHEVRCLRSGFVAAIDTEMLGWGVIELGGGRQKLTDVIDHSVGLEMLVRLGEPIERNQPWIRVFAPRPKFEQVASRLSAALTISDHCPPPMPLILERIAL